MFTDFIAVQYCFQYLIDQIPTGLLLYSHIPTALAALFFGGYVFASARNLSSAMLFGVCITFAAFCFADLSSWFSFLGSANTMFTWSILDLLTLLMFFLAYYFLYTFVTKRDLPMWQKLGGLVLLLPVMVTTFLGENLALYDANNCSAIENGTITSYLFAAEGFIILATLTFLFLHYRHTKEASERRETFLAGVGVILFLVFFFSATLLVSLLSESDSSSYVYNFEIYGLFGMPILLIYLGYLIVRYKAFDLKVFGAQALIVALVVLIGSEFAFVTSLSRIASLSE